MGCYAEGDPFPHLTKIGIGVTKIESNYCQSTIDIITVSLKKDGPTYAVTTVTNEESAVKETYIDMTPSKRRVDVKLACRRDDNNEDIEAAGFIDNNEMSLANAREKFPEVPKNFWPVFGSTVLALVASNRDEFSGRGKTVNDVSRLNDTSDELIQEYLEKMNGEKW